MVMSKNAGIWLIALSVLIAIVFSVVAIYRNLTSLENVLLQVFSLGVGLVGSYVFGRESAKDAAKEMIKPHARSAFRRLLALYSSLSRLASAIQLARDTDSTDYHFFVLEKLEAMVAEQIATADDSLEDWRDIVPEEIEALQAKLATRLKGEINV